MQCLDILASWNSVRLEFKHAFFRLDSNFYIPKTVLMQRGLLPILVADLEEKMVFLGGPRQVGKTTLALGLLDGAKATHPAYLS